MIKDFAGPIGKDILLKNTASIMTESIIKYTGHITVIPVFEVIYKSWENGENYNPSNSNIYVAIIEQIGAGMTIGPRVLKEELRRKGLSIKGSEIDTHLDYLTSKGLVTCVERAKGRAYKLDQDGKNFHEWLHKKNEIQPIQPSDDVNDGLGIFEEILDLWKDKEHLPKDNKYCGNPYVMTLRAIGSYPYDTFVRRDHILSRVQKRWKAIEYDDIGKILDFLKGKNFISEGIPRGKKYVKEYALEKNGTDLYSYIEENCNGQKLAAPQTTSPKTE